MGRFEPREDRKGDVARAVFYVVAVYPELVEPGFFRAMEDDLLVWNRLDPPDDRERVRSTWVASMQGTENPFILDPSLADRIWASGASGSPVGAPEAPSPPAPSGSAASGGALWINEIHYDNVGEDTGEGIEIAGPDGTSLDGWTLVLVNGSRRRDVRNRASGGGARGRRDRDAVGGVDGLQNGSPDGVALVGPDGRVVEALAWEGSFTRSAAPLAACASRTSA